MMNADSSDYITRELTPETWNDFAQLVEANNGVWGGCWCIGFHPEGLPKGCTVERNRSLKQAHVENGTVHQILVYDGDECVGWCQYGSPSELPNIKNWGPTPRNSLRCRTGGLAASSPEAVIVAKVWPGPRSRGHWMPSAVLVVGSSRPTRSKLRTARRSGAHTSTRDPNRCSRTSDSCDREIAKWRWVMRRDVSAE